MAESKSSAPATSGNAGPDDASTAEAKRLQARSEGYPIFTTAYVDIEQRTKAMQGMRNTPVADREDDPTSAGWAREDMKALPHVLPAEKEIALDAIARSMAANRSYAATITQEAPDVASAVAQHKADRAADARDAELPRKDAPDQRITAAADREEPRPQLERDRGATEDIAKRVSDLATRMKGADWSGHLDNPPEGYGTTPELGAIERDLRAFARIDVRAAHEVWSENAPKVFRVPEYVADGAPQRREPEVVKPETQEPAGPKLETLKIDTATQEAVALKRAVDTASAARDLGINMIEPERRRERGTDEPEAAKMRTQAKAEVGERDPERDVKRDAIDRANDTELGKITAAGKEATKLALAFEALADRLRGEQSDAQVRKPSPPLEERFNVVRGLITRRYEFRDQPGKVAFEDRLLSLRTSHSTPSAAIAMMDRAGERGWSRVRVNGSEEFKRQAWIAAEARGIKAVGYEPTKGDRDAATAERARLDNEQRAREKPAERAVDPKRADADRAGPTATAAQGLATPAVLRAFDLAMERQGIPTPQQDALRKELGRQLEAMQATGRVPLVKVYDKDAPRVQAPAVPKVEPRRPHSERVR